MEGSTENKLPDESLPDSQQASETSQNASIQNNNTTSSAAPEETIQDTSDNQTEMSHLDLNTETYNSNIVNNGPPHSVKGADVDRLTNPMVNEISAPITSADSQTSKSSEVTDLSGFKLSKNVEHVQEEKENEQNEHEQNKQIGIEENQQKTSAKESSMTKEEMSNNNSNDNSNNNTSQNELPKSAFFKIDKHVSLYEENMDPLSSAPKMKNSGSFYLQVKGLLEVVNMEELKTQLAGCGGGVPAGTNWDRKSISIKPATPKMNKSRSTSVPIKAISKNALHKDSGNKRIVKKPEVITKMPGLSKTNITPKKGQIPPLMTTTARQILKKPQDAKQQVKLKAVDSNQKVATRVLGAKPISTNEDKPTTANKEKMKATFNQIRKESLQDKNTKSSSTNEEKPLAKIQAQVRPLPPKELITKFKTPTKALPKQFIPLQKKSLEHKEKAPEPKTSPRKDTVRNATAPLTKNLTKKSMATPTGKSAVRNRTVALEENPKSELSKPTSNKVDVKKPLTLKTKTLENMKLKDKKKSLIKESATLKRHNSKPSLKKQETQKKVSPELSKSKSKDKAKEKLRTKSKSLHQEENAVKKVDTATSEKNDDVIKQEEKAEQTKNEEEHEQEHEQKLEQENKKEEQSVEEQNNEDYAKEHEQKKNDEDLEGTEIENKNPEVEEEDKEVEEEKQSSMEGEKEESKNGLDDAEEKKTDEEVETSELPIPDTTNIGNEQIEQEIEKGTESVTILEKTEIKSEKEEEVNESETKLEENEAKPEENTEENIKENVKENEAKPEGNTEENVEENEVKPEQNIEENVEKSEVKLEENAKESEVEPEKNADEIEAKPEENEEETETKHEENVEENSEETEKKPAEIIEKNEAKLEENVEETGVKAEENTEVDFQRKENIKKVEVKLEDVIEVVEKAEGKADATPTSDRKKTDRKKGEGKKSVDIKLVKKATPKVAIATVKKPEFKVKMGIKSKGTIKNVQMTSPLNKSEPNGTPKDKRELKKIATKDTTRSGNSKSLTLRKILLSKKMNDIKKTAFPKSETKDASAEKKKLEEPAEKTSIKISAKGSMKITVKTSRNATKALAKTETKAITKPITKTITKTITKPITKAITKPTTKLPSKVTNKEEEKTTSTKKMPEIEKTTEIETGVEIAVSTEKDPDMTSMQKEETTEKDAEKEMVNVATTPLSTSKIKSPSMNSTSAKSRAVKPISLKGLKLKKTLSKRSNLEKNKFNVTDSNTYRSMLQQDDKGSIAEIEPETGIETKSKELSASVSSKRSVKSKKSASSKYSKMNSASLMNQSLSKKNSSVSDSKSKKSTSRNKNMLDSSKREGLSKGKLSPASKDSKPSKKSKSKLKMGTSYSIEDGDSISKKRLRKSQTKRESLKSSSFNSPTKSDRKLKRSKTETLTKKMIPDFNKLKGKKKNKKENLTPTSDNDLSSRLGTHVSSGLESSYRIKSGKSSEKGTPGIPKIGITNIGSTSVKKTKGGKQSVQNLTSLPNPSPKSVSADRLTPSSTTTAKGKKKKVKETASKKKKGKSTNLLNDTLEEEMKRIIQDNTMLLAEQTDEDIREELLNKEKSLIECKNAVTEKENKQTNITNRRASVMSKTTVGKTNELHKSSFTYDNRASHYPYRSGSVGSGIRNITTPEESKPFNGIYEAPPMPYIINHPNEISDDVMKSSELIQPSSLKKSWLLKNCCWKNTVEDDEPNVTNGRNEPLLKDFSSLINAENKYIPYACLPQIVSNPPHDNLRMSNIYDHNLYKKKMHYFSNNILPVNTTEPSFPQNPKTIPHNFSVKIKKFPDSTPIRASCNCL